MKYKIMNSTSIEELEKDVNAEIDQGWEPLGGIAIASEIENFDDDIETDLIYHQAMIKRP